MKVAAQHETTSKLLLVRLLVGLGFFVFTSTWDLWVRERFGYR